jgi:hypothetical protein
MWCLGRLTDEKHVPFFYWNGVLFALCLRVQCSRTSKVRCALVLVKAQKSLPSSED